ncbi:MULTISPECIES: OmpA family protein [Pseudomonas]|jgi:outer membrane protein OmpA-like peptidoglycan-associated protein|uniref:Membrane protein n=1 Tax=Pseudomonas weihenstephanensis TaxID=1608994 RepID=A0A0J6IK15_9PSED|nr:MULTISPECIES: OmpA family protein [Pseudomonas]KMN12084.1 membrane protein [Pseudomonas weihenstephanensis]KMN16348.1 membrane protein [Pseudomonas weihenstephanensis]KVV06496.1 Outer membrane protein ArfA [Pseudomonas sp. TAD18]KVV08022.1 Outer membrane protein ArfA [Pseudomonas sp. TAA207]MBM1197300.1 OmpA family protein [Pseudomonas weihenstephanensis]
MRAFTQRYLQFFGFTLLLATLALSGCQTAPQKGLSPAQIAVLKQQGFELTDEGWAFGLSGKVLFGSDLEVLNAQSQEIVERIGTALLAVDIQRVRVDGHTDASGQEAYNEQLSVRRANSVVKALTKVGMRPENIQVRGLGSREPVASNKTRAGRTENRRVAIVVIAD